MGNRIRYLISKYSIYTFLFGCLFLLQRGILLHLFDVKQYVICNKIYVYEIVLFFLTFAELKCFTRIDPVD